MRRRSTSSRRTPTAVRRPTTVRTPPARPTTPVRRPTTVRTPPARPTSPGRRQPGATLSPIQRSNPVVRSPQTSYTQPMRPRGVMTNINRIARSLPGALGTVSNLVQAVLPNGQTVMTTMRRRRRRGLTFNDIKGATRVLRLVKKFAPPGSRMRLRTKRS